MGLLLKLDFGNNDTLKNAAVNIDMPRCPRVLDEETLFLNGQALAFVYCEDEPGCDA